MKMLIHNLLNRKRKNENTSYTLARNKSKMAKPLKPVPFYWALIPVDVETAMNKNKKQ